MAYDEAGSGEPLVLLHSGVCDRRMWQPQWESLSQSFRVVRPDLRGFGETPLPPGRFSFVGDVVELLDHLSIERACVVGSSLGGRVALELAVTVPERVRRLVLLCPAFQGLEPTPAVLAFDEAEDAFLDGGDLDGFVELNVSTWLGPEADERTRDQVRLMQRRAVEVQLAAEQGPEPPQLESAEVDPDAISVPTLVVSGGQDLDHFQAIANHLAETMPNAGLVRLDWAGHLPSLERPEPVTELIAEFCGS